MVPVIVLLQVERYYDRPAAKRAALLQLLSTQTKTKSQEERERRGASKRRTENAREIQGQSIEPEQGVEKGHA